MIQKETKLKVIDNSGAKDASCIHVLNGYRKRYAFLGDLIIVSVKSLRKSRRLSSKVKKGDVVKALLARTRSKVNFYSGDSLQFFENGVILLTAQNKIFGTKIFGTLPHFFRKTKFLKILSLSAGVVNF
jgi:large subunit ribosomal protein L14